MIWFTADTHFGHENIIKYCNRQWLGNLFQSVEEMDEQIIANWNYRINKDDVVYHLGDFSFKNEKTLDHYLYRLNGKIWLVRGGHDKYYAPRIGKFNLASPILELGKEYLSILGGVDIGVPIVLCHYAMRVWEKSHFNSYHLYGHSHGLLPGEGRSMDVGVDTNNFYPYSLQEVVSKLESKNNINLVLEERKG
jgi:calcineurin-like phosphoesterase family protein